MKNYVFNGEGGLNNLFWVRKAVGDKVVEARKFKMERWIHIGRFSEHPKE